VLGVARVVRRRKITGLVRRLVGVDWLVQLRGWQGGPVYASAQLVPLWARPRLISLRKFNAAARW
jgi:hypothetical protein